MQKEVNKREVELVEKLYKLYLVKFNGNNSEFARASLCSETTIRRVFKNEQGITLNLFLRMCHALNVNATEIFEGL